MPRPFACLLLAAPIVLLPMHHGKPSQLVLAQPAAAPQQLLAKYDPNDDPAKDYSPDPHGPDPHGADPHDEVHDPHLPGSDSDAYSRPKPPPPKDDDKK